MNKLVLSFFLIVLSIDLHAQAPLWAFNIGSTTDDNSRVVKVAPNGNVCIAGIFTGTMDLDPGPGVYNITSNGLTDIFVACYTPTGSFLWGFGIGGPSYDGAYNITIDLNNNVIVGGAFQSGGIDFDPGPGVTILPYAGGAGLPYEGDGFVAKFSSTGVFQWAKDLGGPTVYDFVEGLATDSLGNIYVGGEFNTTMVVSGTITFSSAVAGTGYIIKYNPAGTVIWAHNFGEYGISAVDCAVMSMEVSHGYIYVGGVFRGTSNFDPWGVAAWCTAITGGPSAFNPFVAKYDTTGNFVFVKQISSTGNSEYSYDIALDSLDNVYITGWTNGSAMTFDQSSPGTSTFSAPGGGGNNDIFLAKYDKTGNYQWGELFGSPGNDQGWHLTVSQGYLYCTGQFEQTVDMDPSPAVANLISTGGADIYLTKYDLNGNYICGFSVGSALTDDIGYGLDHDPAGNIYATGQFGGTAVDFDPTAGVYPLTSNGATDVYLAKYAYTSSTAPVGFLVADTICAGQTAQATLVITSGSTGPFTIIYSDGTTSYTQAGVMSGVPFTLLVSPTVTTTYTITSITYPGMNICTAPSGTAFGSFTVVVNPAPLVSLGNDTTFCLGNTLILQSPQPAGSIFLWSTGSAIDSIHVSASGTYWLKVTKGGCFNTDTIHVVVSPTPVVNLGPDTSNCFSTAPITLQSSVTYSLPTYLWSTGATTPSIVALITGSYWLDVTIGGCTGSDTINVTVASDTVHLFNNDTAICKGISVPVFINANPLATFQWMPTAGIPNSTVSSPVITPDTSAMYYVTISLLGCPPVRDSIYIDVQPNPVLFAGGNRTVCQFDTLHLSASITPNWYTHYTYTWSPATFLDDPTKSTVVYTAGADTKYYLMVTTPAGCHTKDSASITVYPGNFATMDTNFSVCPHDSVQFIPSGGVSYQWHPGLYLNDSNSATPWAYPITSISYTAIATSVNGCLDTITTSIVVHPAAVLYVVDSVTIYPGQSYQINPQTNCDFFLWTPAAGLNNDQISNPLATPQISTKYRVYGTTEWGCKAEDSIEIYLGGTLLALPNAFTPGSGVNNKLFIIVQGEATLNYFRIFNRWGNKVFETSNINEGWDGTYHGTPQPYDVYVYQVEAVTIEGRVMHKSGNVTLIR